MLPEANISSHLHKPPAATRGSSSLLNYYYFSSLYYRFPSQSCNRMH